MYYIHIHIDIDIHTRTFGYLGQDRVGKFCPSIRKGKTLARQDENILPSLIDYWDE
jgi:hypothetical protein